jgi:hypothetical protein
MTWPDRTLTVDIDPEAGSTPDQRVQRTLRRDGTSGRYAPTNSGSCSAW